ncbi:MAG: S8 family peptidase, partial [Methylotenera sp.]
MPSNYRFDHILINAFRTSETYGRPNRAMGNRGFQRDRNVHGPRLERDLTAALVEAHQLLTQRLPDIPGQETGVYLEVQSADGEKLPDLNWISKGIRLGAVRLSSTQEAEVGALFVPTTAAAFLTEKIREYAHENTTSHAPRPKNQDKIEPIETIRAASLESLWTDQRPFPDDPQQRIWWECWCWSDRAAKLVLLAERLNLRAISRSLTFPDFEVVPVYGNRNEILRLVQNSAAIEELRHASDNPAFFTVTARREQNLWVNELVGRVRPPGERSPAVCILDSGVARAHPLLEIAIPIEDCHTINSAWGVDDGSIHGHGTNMAGSTLYGDLTSPLSDAGDVDLMHGVESVKFLPPPGQPSNDPLNYGSITQAAVALPEVSQPERSRVYCMAVTNRDVSGERPTSWSAAVDQVCAGVMLGDIDEDDEDGVEGPRRLFVVSVGNLPDASNPDDISDLDEYPVEDPAQAWNAIGVGGFTDKVDIAAADNLPTWQALAVVGDLSPYSRISTDWNHSRTPIKPEIVFESGNKAINSAETELLSGVDSLSMLTTSQDFLAQPITTFWATSAAAAQAASMAAVIMARHPDLWPETVRALMIQSAEWTPAMKARFDACRTKRECIQLARTFGYGVPRLDRALASAQNDLALVAQAYIKPFKRERVTDANGRSQLKGPTFDEVHYYTLPWPQVSLEGLDSDVRLKVTLSYFIEPSPGATAPVAPAQYQSHGLRFELKRSDETEAAFRQRINRLEDSGEELPAAAPDDRWLLGSKSIAAGSLHCDIWTGPAADLAARNVIAVYPVSGWWRYRTHLKRYDSRARYSLVVSIASPENEVQFYSEIAQIIGIGVETE